MLDIQVVGGVRRVPAGTYASGVIEIGIHDVYPFIAQSASVRASLLMDAAELLSRFSVFMAERDIRSASALARWQEFIELYRDELEIALGDLSACRVVVEGEIVDPAGTWSPEHPRKLPIVGAAS